MKSMKMFGKSVPLLAIVMVSLLAVGASAALLTYYGSITKEVIVTQAVLLDGLYDYTQPIEETVGPVVGGTTICQTHWLENKGPKPATIYWDSSVSGDAEIDVLVLASVHAEYNTYGKDVEATIVQEWECSTTSWVIDIESDNPAGHNYGVGLAISLDGTTPAFQVWYARSLGLGAPSIGWFYNKYDAGWGPCLPLPPGMAAIGDGASGEKHFEIYIDCEWMCGAGAEYKWNLQLLTNLISWVGDPYGWDADASGFIPAQAGVPISFPYTLDPYGVLDFNLAFNTDPLLVPGTYTVTTTFKPAP